MPCDELRKYVVIKVGGTMHIYLFSHRVHANNLGTQKANVFFDLFPSGLVLDIQLNPINNSEVSGGSLRSPELSGG